MLQETAAVQLVEWYENWIKMLQKNEVHNANLIQYEEEILLDGLPKQSRTEPSGQINE